MNITAPFLHWPETKVLLARADALGMELRFVGGSVRDALLNRTVTDIDLATPTLPQDVLETLPDGDIKTYPTGIDHGTITARIGDTHFEITTLREDVACDGRHADVRYSTDWKRDAMRRDFTINALYAKPSGEVIDAVGGLADLTARTLRFIGTPTDRIIEDGLRILRFFRFAAELEFTMDVPSLSACTHQSACIESLSGERIQLEFFKLLSRMKNAEVLQLMHAKGVLQHVLPYSLNTSLDEALKHTHDPVILLALMLGGRDEDMARKDIKHRLKLSNAQFDLLEKVLESSPPTTLAEAKKLLRAVGETAYRGVVLKTNPATFLDLPTHWHVPEFPVKASDLLARGFTEGKALGAALKTLEARWEMSDYQLTKTALLEGV